ncbi:MAG: hypothetical protein RL026_975 [Pseudomonadota bacterium]
MKLRVMLQAGAAALALLGTSLPPPAGAAVRSDWVATPRAMPAAPGEPVLAASRSRPALDLVAQGYREQEYWVAGQARVYDWPVAAGGDPTVRDHRNDYQARILVRRPADPARASGRVVVELLVESAGTELAPLWSLSAAGLVAAGDVWVGASLHPGARSLLQRLDAGRYAALRVPEPAAPDCLDANGSLPLLPDMLAQLAVLLRSGSKENPLAGIAVGRVVAAGAGPAATQLALYHQLAQERLRGVGDAPLFDAYLLAEPDSLPAVLCLRTLDPTDPVAELAAADVPVVVLRHPSKLPPSVVGPPLASLPVLPSAPAPAARAAPPGQPAAEPQPPLPLAPAVYLLGHAGLAEAWSGTGTAAGSGPGCAAVAVGPAAAMAQLWRQLDDAMLRGIPLPVVTPVDYGACLTVAAEDAP